MHVKYLLTTYSATMFGDRASIHQRAIRTAEACRLIGPDTMLVATRAAHENLAKRKFGDMATTRYADMTPETSAVLIHYRGPPVADDGIMPEGGIVTLYLIESEEYLETED